MGLAPFFFVVKILLQHTVTFRLDILHYYFTTGQRDFILLHRLAGAHTFVRARHGTSCNSPQTSGRSRANVPPPRACKRIAFPVNAKSKAKQKKTGNKEKQWPNHSCRQKTKRAKAPQPTRVSSWCSNAHPPPRRERAAGGERPRSRRNSRFRC